MISSRCQQRRHKYDAGHWYGWKCEGLAYPGPLTAEPVPCDCRCHKGEIVPDVQVMTTLDKMMREVSEAAASAAEAMGTLVTQYRETEPGHVQ